MFQTDPNRLSRYRRVPWIVLIIGLAAICSIIGIDLLVTRQSLLQRENDRLIHAAEVVEATLSRRMQSTANALDGLAPELLALRAGEEDRTASSHRLEIMVSAMTGVRTLLLADAGGQVLASNRPLLIDMNFHDDGRYRSIRGDPDQRKLFVSPPFITPHGVYTITLGKAVLDTDGRFAGYVIAALDPEYFDALLNASVYAPDMRAMLVHGSGKIIYRVPDDEKLTGQDLGAEPHSLFNRHLASGQMRTVVTGLTASTAEDRIAAFHSITPSGTPADQPLVVVLARRVDALLAPWYRDALVRGLLFSALALMAVVGLWISQRRQHAIDRLLAAEEAERTRLEQALAADRQYLAEVVWGTDAGTWEWNLASNAVRFNDRWASLLGYTLDELSPVSLDTWRRLTHPDDLTELEKRVERLIQGDIDSFEARVRMRHKDTHWVWILDRGRVVERRPDGQALRLAGAHLDVSDAHAAELRTQTALRYARSLLEASLDPIVTIGLDGRIMDVNEATESLTGQNRDLLIGSDFADCFTEPDKAREGYRRVFSEGRVRDYPLTLRHLGGCTTEVLYNASVFRDERNEVAGVFAAARDVTQLRASQRELERTNAEVMMLGRLSDMLQSCRSVTESVPIIQASLMQLFPSTSGRIYLVVAEGRLLSEASHWGEASGEGTSIAPADCWALRRSHVHDIGFEPGINPRCRHMADETRPYLCLPLQAQGLPLGLIHIVTRGTPEAVARYRDLAAHVTDSISLALANLRLRENLEALSIRDPLTGLYNRRFMEEGLTRELVRADRSHRPLAVAMLDLDHFKRFNDTYGHDAGDAVLIAFAEQMKGFRVGSDIACRFGGEEFLVVLAEVDRDAAVQRLEALRAAVAQLTISHGGHLLPPVTVSIGVALFPEHGHSSAALIKAADEALYRAKDAGRNTVFVAASPSPQPLPPSPIQITNRY